MHCTQITYNFNMVPFLQFRHSGLANDIPKVSMMIDYNIDLLSQDLIQLVVKETRLKITKEKGEVKIEETRVEPEDDNDDGVSSSDDDSLQWEVSTDDDNGQDGF